jgi:hypothetical protein
MDRGRVQLGADGGVVSHTTGQVANSSTISWPPEYATKQTRETQRHGDNNIKHNMQTRWQGEGGIDPHK